MNIPMKNDFFFVPSVERIPRIQPDHYEKDSKVKNKYLNWFFTKVFDLMMKKGFLKNQTLIETAFNVTKNTIDLDKLDYQICQNQQAIEMVYQQRVETIIVGADIMRKFISGDPYKVGFMDFNMGERESNYYAFSSRHDPFSYGLEQHYERVKYRGLNIICIPWFEGFLLIPKKS